MCGGDSIEFRDSGGRSLKIFAKSEVKRQYVVGDTLIFTVDLTPRNARWFGSRGLYRPRGVGSTHMTLEESIQHFASVEEAKEWIDFQSRIFDDRMTAIDDSGLFVQWTYGARPPGHRGGPDYRLSVDVYQILVNLQKPQGLGAASDGSISQNLSASCDAKAFEPGYQPSKPAVLGGREYPGRALDFMRDRGLDSKDIEQLITNGTNGLQGAAMRQDGDETVYYNKKVHPLEAVRVDATGRIKRIS